MRITREEASQILEVSPDAPAADIKTAFRALALRYHPDKNQGCTEAAETFKKISAAYAR